MQLHHDLRQRDLQRRPPSEAVAGSGGLINFLFDRLTEELARVWARDGAYAGAEQRRRPGVAAQVAVLDDLITALKQGRLPERRELRILLAGYSCHADFDPQWSELARD